MFDGDFLSIDQSALTGESLPVSKKVGEVGFSGSVARQGEMLALVTGTGSNTFFGRTASLVQTAGGVSHFQKAVLHIGDYLIYLSLGLVAVLIVVQFERGDRILTLVQFALILTVASIPVAMPAVLSVTMAVGALAMSKMKAIVTRLESIEEMAGIDILCSDKTGTLTQNRLTLGEPVALGAKDAQELIRCGALASREEDRDPIDLAVIGGLKDKEDLKNYRLTKFVPFDPVHKRTESTIEDSQKKTFRVTKGAPQVIIDLCQMDPDTVVRAQQVVNDMAVKGYRTLGVAPVLLWSAIITKLLATLLVVYPFGLITPISWRSVGIVWAYCIVWLFMGDLAKLAVYRRAAGMRQSPRHGNFLHFDKRRLNPILRREGRSKKVFLDWFSFKANFFNKISFLGSRFDIHVAFRTLQRRLIVLLVAPVTLFILGFGFYGYRFIQTILFKEWGDSRHPAPGASRPPDGYAPPWTDGADGDLSPGGTGLPRAEIQRWLLHQIKSQAGVLQVILIGIRQAGPGGLTAIRDRSAGMSPIAVFLSPRTAKPWDCGGSSRSGRAAPGPARGGGELRLSDAGHPLSGLDADPHGLPGEREGHYLAHTNPAMQGRHCLGETQNPLELAMLKAMKEKPYGTLMGEGYSRST